MTPARLASLLLAGVVGATTGVCAIGVDGFTWGALLGAGAILATTYAAPPGAIRVGFVAGVAIAVGVAVLGRPEGDWAIVADARGYLLLGSTLLALCFGVATAASGTSPHQPLPPH